jgi:hypothetical protein
MAGAEFHSETQEAAVFDDERTWGHKRLRIATAVALIIGSVVAPQLSRMVAGKIGNPVAYSLLAFGIILLISEAHAYFLNGESPGRKGFIIVDKVGIGSAALKSLDTRIEWARIRSFETDQRAVVVKFAPCDLNSSDPRDRISEIRLASPNADAEMIMAAIHRFRPRSE